ncbi:hypothetical protein BC834DRAFT_1041380 [Gloeopeniophorella convolvens]|nr:hypothetical protein BC834DRAFT_1041380 [Gloeopeniophorella convolvens]
MPSPSIHLSDIFSPSQAGPTQYKSAPRERSSDKLWSIYLAESDRQDRANAQGWKDDANGFLVFAGLFTLTVATFIVESYKELSADSSNESVLLLRQISLQLASQGGTAGAAGAVGVTNPAPFHPSTPVVCVNAMWLLSLVLSISSALAATLMQGWACRYIQLPHLPAAPAERARVRAYLYRGVLKYGVPRAVEAAPMLLHLAIALFLAGLVVFFFTIFRTVAIVLAAGVGVLALAYAVLTVLPCIDLRSPYRTPMSNVLWFAWHAALVLPSSLAFGLVNVLHSALVPPNLGDITSRRQRVLARWLESLGASVRTHTSALTHGVRRSVVRAALHAPPKEDTAALAWLLDTPALAHDAALEAFIASAPDSTLLQLTQHPAARFRDRLHALLQSGLATGDAAPLAACLRALQPTLCAYNGVVYRGADFDAAPALLDDLRARFAPPDVLHALCVHTDPAVRTAALGTRALLARTLLRRRTPPSAAQLAWLRDALGAGAPAQLAAPGGPAALEHANTDAFVRGALARGGPGTAFAETLAVLLGAGGRADFQRKAEQLLRRAERDEALRDVRVPLREALEGVSGGGAGEEALVVPPSPHAPSSRPRSPSTPGGTAGSRRQSVATSQLMVEVGSGRLSAAL